MYILDTGIPSLFSHAAPQVKRSQEICQGTASVNVLLSVTVRNHHEIDGLKMANRSRTLHILPAFSLEESVLRSCRVLAVLSHQRTIQFICS